MIVKVVKVLRSGSSMPVIVENEQGARWLMKLKGSGGGGPALTAEWLASSIGRAAGLPILEPHIFTVRSFESEIELDIEEKELLEKSIGSNIAFPYLENAMPFHTGEGNAFKEDETLIYLFDCFLLNIDRYPLNLNVIVSDDMIYSIDYDASLLFREISEQRSYRSDAVIKQLRRNSFFAKDANPEPLLQQLGKCRFQEVKNIVDAIPEDWLMPGLGRENFAQRLYTEITVHVKFLDLLKRVNDCPALDEEQLRRSRKRNSHAFQQKHKL